MVSKVNLKLLKKNTKVNFQPYEVLLILKAGNLIRDMDLSLLLLAIHCNLSRSWNPFQKLKSYLQVFQDRFLLNKHASHRWLFSSLNKKYFHFRVDFTWKVKAFIFDSFWHIIGKLIIRDFISFFILSIVR